MTSLFQISVRFPLRYHQLSLFIRYHVSSCIIRYQPFSSLYCCLLTFPHRPHHHPNHQHHGPLSTIQKTGWVWSGLEKGFTYLWMRSLGRSQNPLSCVFGHFWHGDEQTKKQTKQANNWLVQVQACSRPVRRQSFATIDELVNWWSARQLGPNWHSWESAHFSWLTCKKW